MLGTGPSAFSLEFRPRQGPLKNIHERGHVALRDRKRRGWNVKKWQCNFAIVIYYIITI